MKIKSMLSLLALLQIGLCSPLEASTATPVRFVLDWLIGGRHAGWFVALDKGFYEKANLAVTISRGYGAEDGVKRLAAGECDIDFNDMAVAILARVRSEVPIKTVAMLYQKQPSMIFTLRSDNIREPKDLEGKTLAESAGSVNLLLFPAFAKAAGFDASKIKWALVPPDAKMQALITKKVQGTLFLDMQLPLMTKATAALGGVDTIAYGDYMKMYNNGILIRDDYLAAHSDAVRAFIEASREGWMYAIAHPDEAADIVLAHQPMLDREVTKAEIAVVKELMQSPDTQAHGWGHMDEATVAATRDTMLELSNLPATVPTSDLYSNDYLPSH